MLTNCYVNVIFFSGLIAGKIEILNGLKTKGNFVCDAVKWTDIAGFVIQFLTLLTTVFFTYQLVRNDNNRQKKTDDEKLKNEIKSSMILMAGESSGKIIRVTKEVLEKYPNQKRLIFECYTEIALQYKTMPNVLEFKRIMGLEGIEF